MHYLKSDVNRLYIPKNKEGRGMMQLELSYKTSTLGLDAYLKNEMMELVKHHEKSKKLHSVTKKALKFIGRIKY